MAERAGFEPAEACTSAVFKTDALNHSTISPHQKSAGNITLKNENSSFFAGNYLLFQENLYHGTGVREDGLPGSRELLLRRKRRIRSVAGAHLRRRRSQFYIQLVYSVFAYVLRVLRILRILCILRFRSRAKNITHPMRVTRYTESGKTCRKNYLTIDFFLNRVILPVNGKDFLYEENVVESTAGPGCLHGD